MFGYAEGLKGCLLDAEAERDEQPEAPIVPSLLQRVTRRRMTLDAELP